MRLQPGQLDRELRTLGNAIGLLAVWCSALTVVVIVLALVVLL